MCGNLTEAAVTWNDDRNVELSSQRNWGSCWRHVLIWVSLSALCVGCALNFSLYQLSKQSFELSLPHGAQTSVELWTAPAGFFLWRWRWRCRQQPWCYFQLNLIKFVSESSAGRQQRTPCLPSLPPNLRSAFHNEQLPPPRVHSLSAARQFT